MQPTISILGSGWLGLPLAKYWLAKQHTIKASTTSEHRLDELRGIGAQPYLIDTASLDETIADFLNADILVVNIPCKDITQFNNLVPHIEASPLKYLLFVSSTSVYQDVADVVKEDDLHYLSQSPLLAIEKLFQSLPNLSTTVLRCGGLVGGRRHPGRFFGPGRVIPNPEAPVNLIHLDDCLGLIDGIVSQAVWGEVFNACADSHPEKGTFYRHAASQIGQLPASLGEQTQGTGKIVSNAKIKAALNYRFKHPDLMQIRW